MAEERNTMRGRAVYSERAVVVEYHVYPPKERKATHEKRIQPYNPGISKKELRKRRKDRRYFLKAFRSTSREGRGLRFHTKDGVHQITVYPGYICSTDGTSHVRANNVNTTVFRSYDPYRMADDSDDEHEMSFKVNDPHLLKRGEANSLKNPQSCIAWFRGIYPSNVAELISKALRRSNLDETEGYKMLRREIELMENPTLA